MNGVLNEAEGVFALMVSAIFLEAAPFLVLGAFLSALSEVFLTPERLARWIPQRQPVQLLFGIAAGLVFPTCECGVVPIARRFIQKGVPARMALSYMLSAPIMNPLVMASTYVAFQGSVSMVLGRVFMAVVCAAVTASLVTGKQGSILRERNGPEETTVFPLASADECSHAGCGCEHSVAHRSRVVTVFRHAAAEFIEMGKYLLFGAAASSALKLYLPQDIMGFFGDSVYLSVALMMGLAIVFSVCSEADAFVAASFWSFSRTAQLSFIAIGPMVDLKLIAAYGGVFDRRTGIVLTLTPVLLVYVLSVLLGGVGGVSL